jgi:hypothetical protein
MVLAERMAGSPWSGVSGAGIRGVARGCNKTVRKEGSGSFLKKRTKKLLFVRSGTAVDGGRGGAASK